MRLEFGERKMTMMGLWTQSSSSWQTARLILGKATLRVGASMALGKA